MEYANPGTHKFITIAERYMDSLEAERDALREALAQIKLTSTWHHAVKIADAALERPE